MKQPVARPTVAGMDEFGHEIPDPVPMAPPLGYKRQVPLHEQIRMMVRSEKLRQEAEDAGFESFEESDDFEVGDDLDPSSPYEDNFEGSVDDLRSVANEAIEAGAAHLESKKRKKGGGDEPPSGTKAAKPPESGEPK